MLKTERLVRSGQGVVANWANRQPVCLCKTSINTACWQVLLIAASRPLQEHHRVAHAARVCNSLGLRLENCCAHNHFMMVSQLRASTSLKQCL